MTLLGAQTTAWTAWTAETCLQHLRLPSQFALSYLSNVVVLKGKDTIVLKGKDTIVLKDYII